MAVNNRTAEALETLSQGIARLTSSEHWLDYLRAQRAFHNYSFGNVMLIASQRPDASRVAGFHSWLKLGRHVLRGEHAIWILAPMIRRRPGPELDVDHDDEGVVMGFRAVPVWDISQTAGEDLPSVCTRLVCGSRWSAFHTLRQVAGRLGYTVEDDADLAGEANGDCNFALRRIRIRGGLAAAQAVKTLAHEIAHSMLHADATDRALAELEAESVAFVVCDGLQLDSSSYSFGYVSTWAGGGEEAIAAIKASGARIQKTAAHILNMLPDESS